MALPNVSAFVFLSLVQTFIQSNFAIESIMHLGLFLVLVSLAQLLIVIQRFFVKFERIDQL